MVVLGDGVIFGQVGLGLDPCGLLLLAASAVSVGVQAFRGQQVG